MISQVTTIKNPSGLHARPAAVFAKAAGAFSSSVTVRRNEEGAEARDAKSMLMLMGMGLTTGTEIEICAEGADEEAAVADLVTLVESGCGE